MGELDSLGRRVRGHAGSKSDTAYNRAARIRIMSPHQPELGQKIRLCGLRRPFQPCTQSRGERVGHQDDLQKEVDLAPFEKSGGLDLVAQQSIEVRDSDFEPNTDGLVGLDLCRLPWAFRPTPRDVLHPQALQAVAISLLFSRLVAYAQCGA